jgi:CheY-like chemotaxis protein
MQLKDTVILVVDDEPDYLDITTGWLEREGCRVLTANNGAEALQCLEKNSVHAIITDIRMPVMGGTELVMRMKATGKYTPTAVSISGFSDLPPREAYDLGIEAQLAKPVSRKVLVSTLERALLDREKVWALPFHSGKMLEFAAKFDSVASALEKKLIAFGRGGFCLRKDAVFPEETSVAFQLNFSSDQKIVDGQAIVRWTAEKERLMGLEITRVREPGRAWLAALARENKTVSFIPRSVS